MNFFISHPRNELLETTVIARFSATLLLVASFVGCGPQTGSLVGKVTFEGQPVTSGIVTAIGPNKIPMGAPIKSNGSYEIRDVGIGNVRIAVESPDPSTLPLGPVGEPNARVTPVPANTNWREIPARYSDFNTSELAVDLRSGTTPYDIVLKP